jgi:hypothetical protein
MSKKRTVTFFCVALVLSSLLLFNQIMFAETIPTEGLVAYYPFNGNANDESGNGNHGTVFGAIPVTDRFANLNKAFYFNGSNNYITVNTNQLSITQNLSISTWVTNIDNLFADGYGNYLISKGILPKPPWCDYCFGLGSERDIGFTIVNESGASYYVTGKLPDNSYHHIAGIYDYTNSRLRLYIDGVLVDETSASGRIKNSNNSFYIGDWNGASTWHFWRGFVDDVRIYNRALSGSEVQTLYHEGDWPPNLLQNLSFDNGINGWYCVKNALNAQTETSWDTTDYATAPGSLKVQCYDNGASYRDIQLLTNRFNLIKDRTYLLTFKAKSSAGFTIPYIKLNQAVSPWTDYAAPYTGLTINNGWRDYTIIFTANATVSDARVTFFLGGALPNGVTFNLDDVSLKEFVANPPPSGELLSNPGFDLGNTGWNLSCDSAAQASGYLDSTDVDTAPASYRIDCVQSGSSINGVQLFTMPFNLMANKKYQLTFKAKCSSNFAIPSIRLMKATSPWTIYAWPLPVVSVATDWQTYTVNFTAYSTASDGRLNFFLGNALPSGAVFWIDSVSLTEVGR